MKRFFELMLLCATIMLFVSCEKDNESPLKGTLYSHEETTLLGNTYTHYVEFIDNQNVKIWDTGGNGPYYGTYSVTGDNIIFSNIHNKYWGYYYVKAIYTSKTLTVYHKYDDRDTLYSDVYKKE